jgi:hypothetical protein
MEQIKTNMKKSTVLLASFIVLNVDYIFTGCFKFVFWTSGDQI